MPRGRGEEQTGTAARRRRSRSPLRAVSKKSKSLMGSLVSKKKKAPVPDLSFEEAASKIASKATRSPARPGAEEETVYGVVLDKDSKALPASAAATPTRPAPARAASPKAAAPGSPLQVVLLLMDPETRRFELLQLEFDSDKAVVADVLSQIALSATEESLRTQTYTGVADRTGAAKSAKDLLSAFCQANDVILAIPKGMKASQCSKLARPILGDPKVNTMLNPAVAAAKAPKSAPEKQSSSVFGILIPVLIAFLLFKLNDFVTSPLAPGDVLPPGLFRSKCGILSVLPESITGCDPALLKMGTDGVLSFYAGDDLLWEMKGAVCPEGNDACEPGAVLDAKGKVTIGGARARVRVVGGRGVVNTPWPFDL